MAVAFDNLTGFTLATPVTSIVASHTVTGSNPYLFVGTLGTAGAADLVSTVTYNGVGLTQIGTVRDVGGVDRWVGLWYLVGPATGSHTCQVNASSADLLSATVVSYNGVKQVAPEATGSAHNDSTTSLDNVLTSTSDNAWHIMIARANTGQVAAGANTTSRGTDSSGNCTMFDGGADINPPGSNTITGTRPGNSIIYNYGAIIAPAVSGTHNLSTIGAGG